MTPLHQHQDEIQKNLDAWSRKPLLQKIYAQFYERILEQINPAQPGLIVEIGSGIGNLKARLPQAICTDLFPNPWLDLVCDGYELPFADASVSHLVLFDVFHHLQAPRAFLREARRALKADGKVILFEPFISLSSYPVYGLLHHEPVGFGRQIPADENLPRPRDYYAAQGNATRIFFEGEMPDFQEDWICAHNEAFSAFRYLLSGGYSKPAFYSAAWYDGLTRLDQLLSRWPRLFAARCLVVLAPTTRMDEVPLKSALDLAA
jgi:SAM-dependent methyltransferase